MSKEETTVTNIQRLIDSMGITQAQLSERTALPKYRISNICTGKYNHVRSDLMYKICIVLNCSLDDAFGDRLNLFKDEAVRKSN